MPKFIAIPTFTVFLLVAAAVWINVAPAQAAPPESKIQTADVEQKLEPFRLRAGNLATKLLAALERTNRLFNRAGVLITKFEERGLDMTSARAAQAEATVAIEQAKQAIDKFKNEVPTVTTATAKTLQQSVRKTAGEANQAIKKAHAKVVEIIRLIRASYDRPTARTATTTP